MTGWRVIAGDCRESLRSLDAGSVQTCVTSPPYFGLRDYGHDGQVGHEPTPDEFAEVLVSVFREVRRVLADDGTLWLNLGDSYASPPPGRNSDTLHRSSGLHGVRGVSENYRRTLMAGQNTKRDTSKIPGVKPKDLIGVPWMVAFALRADGWFLRSEIIWHKTSCMPEAVKDRPTKAHETIFLLTKQPRYFYDAEAIRELSDPAQVEHNLRYAREYDAHTDRAADTGQPGNVNHVGIHGRQPTDGKRNKRTVWTVATYPYGGAHFATFPPKLIEPCILAGSREGDTVLDPFSGSGTTGLVALRHGRSYIGCELNEEYVELSRRRIVDDAPLLNSFAEMAA